MNLIAGSSTSLVSISRSRPLKTPGASWKASRASAVGSSWALKTGDALSTGMPATSAALRIGEESASAFAPGSKAVKKRSEDCRKGSIAGRSAIAVSRVSGPFEIVSWMKGRETRAKAAKVRSRATKRVPLISATGATVALKASSARQKPPKSVEGATRLRERRLGAFGQFAQGAEGGVQLRPAAGEGVAEAGLVLADRVAGLFVEHAEEFVDVDRFGARRRRAGSFRPALKPFEESPGTICTYLRPSGDFGRMIIVELTGTGSAILSRLRLSSAAKLPFLQFDRLHRLDDADPGAADPHLVAFDQRLRVRDLGLEVVGGDEGQAVVGVVGEEDGDQDDEHGDRPDQDRVARYSLYSAAVFHGPRR